MDPQGLIGGRGELLGLIVLFIELSSNIVMRNNRRQLIEVVLLEGELEGACQSRGANWRENIQ